MLAADVVRGERGQQRSDLASLDKNVFTVGVGVCVTNTSVSVGLSPFWDWSRLLLLHWRGEGGGGRGLLGVQVREGGGAGPSVHLQQQTLYWKTLSMSNVNDIDLVWSILD